MADTAPSKKAPEAACPACGGGLAKSPAGQRVLQHAASRMAAGPPGRGAPRSPGMPMGMPRPAPGGMMGPTAPVGPQGAPQGPDPRRVALMRMLAQRVMQARARGGAGTPGMGM